MKNQWKFLVYEPSVGFIIRNMSNEFLAYETSKGFSSLIVRPIPFTHETREFFNRDINSENNIFKIKTHKIVALEDVPEDLEKIKNLFNVRLKFLTKVTFYVESRLFEIHNSLSEISDRYIEFELERIYRDDDYHSQIISEYATELGWSYESFLQQLKIYDHEKRMRTIRMQAKFRKFCDQIHTTDDYEIMDNLTNEFLQSWQLDRLQ
jgi:hypothetical protein